MQNSCEVINIDSWELIGVDQCLHFGGFGGVRIDLKGGVRWKSWMLERQRTQFFLKSLGGEGFLKDHEFEISSGHYSSPNFHKNPRKDQKTNNSNIQFNNLWLSHGHKKIAKQTKRTIKNLIYLSRKKGNSLDLKIQFLRLQ